MAKAKLSICVHGHYLAECEVDLDKVNATVADILVNPATTEPGGPIFTIYCALPSVGQVLLSGPATTIRESFKDSTNGQ